jgi:hypothetical protein
MIATENSRGATRSNTMLTQSSEEDKESPLTTTLDLVYELTADDVEEEHPALQSLPEGVVSPDRHERLAESRKIHVSRGDGSRQWACMLI